MTILSQYWLRTATLVKFSNQISRSAVRPSSLKPVCQKSRFIRKFVPAWIRSVKSFATVSVTEVQELRPLSTVRYSTITRMSTAEKKPFTRLPSNVVPENYVVKLKPDLQAFTFEGTETVSVQVKSSTKTIVVNSADIDVQSVGYEGQGQKLEGTTTFDKDAEKATFTFTEELKPGSGKLVVAFTGELNNKMKGFYRNKYTTPSGEVRYGATTQFEATDARRAFPCWDEPTIKATFDITLVVPKDRVALSNMPVISEKELDGDLKEITYDRTPIMSTYLVAFVVGEYDYVEDHDADGVKVRVYTGLGKREQGKFALEVAVKTLPFYKDYFNIAYPLPKIDLIAITDFAAGAMENWGLVTYRETALLIDPAHSSASTKQWVALVVGHELAHQWFGNLVTMEWWTHLWLNEGFASWIEYLCVDHVFPEFDIWTQFASTDFTTALTKDSLKNSHPIEVPVGHPSEVDEIFDAISYSKGASVIRMLHDYIGDEPYRKGMHAYLTKHKYKNTVTEDLWEALGEASGKPVLEIMSTWTQKMGYPVLKVSQKKEGTKRILQISQEKFCADGKLEGESPLWMVPVSISTASSPDHAIHRFVLDTKETSITLDNIKETDWIKLNTGAVCFHRTQYSSDMLDDMIPGIKEMKMPPRDRLGLQNDLIALARAGAISAVDVLKVVEAFVNETNLTVWRDLDGSLAGLGSILQYSDCYDQYKKFVVNLYKQIHKKLGWEAVGEESPLDTMLRSLVIGRLGRYGHEPTIAEARKRLEAHCSNSVQIPADMRGPIYSTALAHGDESTFNNMLDLHTKADMHEERVRILRNLGQVKDEALLKKVLDFAMSDKVRSQDTVFVIGGATGSAKGRELSWQFIKDHWKELHQRYQGGFLLARLVEATTNGFVSEEKAKEIEKFFEDNPAPAAARTIKQSLENIRLNEKILKRDEQAIKAFLTSSDSSRL